jgi:hypothetical protein
MAKGQYLSGYQQKIVGNYYEQRDTIFVGKLSAIVSDLALTKDPKETGRLWAKAKEFLGKTSANKVRVEKLLSEKNLEELARVVNELSNAKPGTVTHVDRSGLQVEDPAAGPSPPAASVNPEAGGSPSATTPAVAIPPETLKHALHAYKKRLKLTILNDESRLSPRVMTGGRKSEVVAIIPPDQFPKEVWEELVKQGKLKYTGRGFYELIPGA